MNKEEEDHTEGKKLEEEEDKIEEKREISKQRWKGTEGRKGDWDRREEGNNVNNDREEKDAEKKG